MGAALGFLWFNSYPAQVFMGDVGSLALGGAIGTLAVLTKAELLLPLIGGIYVVEAGSVIIQVASFKPTGRRVFRMAPLHHHFELSGWAEPKIVVRFWILSLHAGAPGAHHAEAAVRMERAASIVAARVEAEGEAC